MKEISHAGIDEENGRIKAKLQWGNRAKPKSMAHARGTTDDNGIPVLGSPSLTAIELLVWQWRAPVNNHGQLLTGALQNAGETLHKGECHNEDKS